MTLSFPHDVPPPPGELITLISGIPADMPGSIPSCIRWAQMPLPFALDHVNVWLLEDESSSVLIDTSIDSSVVRQHWQKLLGQCRRPPETLLITHYHPDHAGLAGWFQREHNCHVIFSAREFNQVSRAWNATDEAFSAGQNDWYQRNGLDQQRRDALVAKGNSYKPLVSEIPVNPTILKQGDTFQAIVPWSVITAAGHSPEMICLYSEELNVLIAGDQVLPRITPNVSLTWYLEDDNPMQSFLDSFDSFAHLPDDVLVLPSHGRPFIGLHERIGYIRSHHDARFDSIQAFCREPRTATDLLPHLFSRELDLQQLLFGMGESLAHLRFMERSGMLQILNENGVDFYQTVSAGAS